MKRAIAARISDWPTFSGFPGARHWTARFPTLICGWRTTRAAHPLMKGLEDAELLINGTYQVEVEPTARFEPPL